MSDLDLVWISHVHADHHLGLLSLLQGRPEGRPLLVVAPMAMRAWLREAASSLDGVGAYRLVTLTLTQPYP